MTSLLDVAFAHHCWATLELVGAVRDLGPSQLKTFVLGTRGPMLDTLRHVIDGDTAYLYFLTQDPKLKEDPERASVDELQRAMERNRDLWIRFLASNPNPDSQVEEIDTSDGYRRTASVGLRLAQALHHGSDHRSQICTALTAIGVRPPEIDAWAFGGRTGQVVEWYPGQ